MCFIRHRKFSYQWRSSCLEEGPQNFLSLAWTGTGRGVKQTSDDKYPEILALQRVLHDGNSGPATEQRVLSNDIEARNASSESHITIFDFTRPCGVRCACQVD